MGKNLFEVYETSNVAENEGQWFNFGPGPSGQPQRFLLARMGKANAKYTSAFRKFQEAYGQQLETGTLSEEFQNECLVEIFVGNVLIDWDGIVDRDNNVMPYSHEAAVSLMLALPELFSDLQAFATNRENYRQVQNKEDAGK